MLVVVEYVGCTMQILRLHQSSGNLEHLRYSHGTCDLTKGGEGRKYVGSSAERGRDVVMSIIVVAS